MIKDKITPELKDKFREAISRTEKIGKEHSILLCKDKKGNLYHRDICTGQECIVQIESAESCRPDKTQGNFHTHADIAVARRFVKSHNIHQFVPKDILINLVKDIAELERTDVATPSYGDLVNALLNKCIKRTEGTVCVGSDAIPDIVDCWTVNNTISKNDCRIARMLVTKGVSSGTPEPWIKPLFDKEKIDLKK